MTGTPPPLDRIVRLEQTVDEIADRQDRLEKLAGRLRREAADTRRELRDLAAAVAGVPGIVAAKLDAQTDDIRVIVAESETRGADRITLLARQWPAGAIVLATVALAVVAAVAANLISAALHGPHIA